MASMMQPIKLSPAFKDYLWGGTRLRDEYRKNCSFEKVAESWELSCHKDGESIVEGGEYDGLTLSALIEQLPKGVLGKNCEKFEQFPILIKFIDARDDLSVQVHPDNEYALRVEGEYGKTEMWYVVDCDPGATLLYGFQKEITKEEFRRHIEENTILDVVKTVPVKKGDVFFISAKTLHAIGKGILIAEIQQNSNTTYRVSDFGRLGGDGKPRPLHIDKALDVTDLKPAPAHDAPRTTEDCGSYRKTILASCDYFTVSQLEIFEETTLETDGSSFHSLLILNGDFTISADGKSLKATKGDSIFLAADTGSYTLAGSGTLLLTTV